jgi:uncharacterized protein
MDEDTQDKIIEFLEDHFITNGTKRLEVCWFGGEPLLAVGAIERLSNKLIELCNKLNISYYADMITNGYRLNSNISHKLKNLGVSDIQITLDGPKKIHDSRRILKSKRSTFKTIMDNVKNSINNVNIRIRVNLDKQNANYLDDLLSELKEIGIQENIFIYLANVEIDPNSLIKEKISLSKKDFFEVNMKFIKNSTDDKFRSITAPSLASNACGADQKYSYMIGPSGELYQCWEDFGKTNMIIGNIKENIRYNQKYSESYFNFDPTTHDKCSKCSVMPMCMGGCPKRRLEYNGEPQCGVYKYQLKETVINYINSLG